ncbi:Hypothetical protein CpCap5W_0643 [Corynebacterium pseudotuberculosis]|nr:Hypothetical protein CpPAT10_2004a [Corynebacterium pseudotuberculosis PAT10]AEX40499.1 Hypothetical protein Cp3995_2056 [Corynebacterium pseudotuberculosis 3/99-5]AFF23140.1 Hypothetical protein CpP54B96_2029 [Corynebacterium pseudotuberculosis P54B96]AFH52941.1 Hypothetical protein Cp267_2071 [Corynebacterium pseudotuberculosis 267]AIG06230.1 hypothetical protein CPTA_00401 [Corynebacterium pseudotuberculosis]
MAYYASAVNIETTYSFLIAEAALRDGVSPTGKMRLLE